MPRSTAFARTLIDRAAELRGARLVAIVLSVLWAIRAGRAWWSQVRWPNWPPHAGDVAGLASVTVVLVALIASLRVSNAKRTLALGYVSSALFCASVLAPQVDLNPADLIASVEGALIAFVLCIPVHAFATDVKARDRSTVQVLLFSCALAWVTMRYAAGVRAPARPDALLVGVSVLALVWIALSAEPATAMGAVSACCVTAILGSIASGLSEMATQTDLGASRLDSVQSGIRAMHSGLLDGLMVLIVVEAVALASVFRASTGRRSLILQLGPHALLAFGWALLLARVGRLAP